MDYVSQRTCLGIPLVHIARGGLVAGRYRRGIAKGWIAVGDISFGILLSFGGIAFGGIAFGGLGFGLVALGGLAMGGLAFGGDATGIGAVGGLAVGLYFAYGGLAVAWHVAAGGRAFAAHANDDVAEAFFGVDNLQTLAAYALPFLLIPALLFFQALIRRRIEPEEPGRR